MWGITPYDNNSQINSFKATHGQTFPSAGTQGGGVAAKNIITSGQNFLGYPTYCVICPDKTIHFDICWPPSLSCFNGYINQCVPPEIVADFSADILSPGPGQTVSFTDLSTNNPTSWSWSFVPSSVTYVDGTNASSQNPKVQFNEFVSYTVTLTASNSVSYDSESKLNYITPGSYCYAEGGGWEHISGVEFGSIINTNTGADDYTFYSTMSTDLTQNQSYDITVTNGSPWAPDDLGVWIDWNQDNDFDDVDEEVVCEISNSGQGTYSIFVPSSAVPGTTRMRVRIKFLGDDCGFPCGVVNYGEVEDYPVNVLAGVDPPVADFSADKLNPMLGETVSFTDLSTNNPTSWSWTFNPTTVTYIGGTTSTSQNPQVQFNEAGTYTVEFTATNAGGSDTETKTDYIICTLPYIDLEVNVYLEGPFNASNMNSDLIPVLPLDQPYNIDPWFYAGSETVPTIPGSDIVDWILVELRDAPSAALAIGSTVLDRQAAFLRNDGKIVDLTGNPMLHFDSSVSDFLYVVIHHRNHLSIMSANALSETGGIYAYDFTTAVDKAYGSSALKLVGTGTWGMFVGDGDHDGSVGTGDKSSLWDSKAGMSGYFFSDYNLDSQTDNIDKDECWIPNFGVGSQVPD